MRIKGTIAGLALPLALASAGRAEPQSNGTASTALLAPGERAVPFANGCAYVTSDTRQPSPKNWYGGCRFGLAHGIGVSQGTDGGSTTPMRYQYGVALGTIAGVGQNSPYTLRANDGFYLTRMREDGKRDWVQIPSPAQNIAVVDGGHVVSLSVTDNNVLSVDEFTPVALACTGQGTADWKGATVSATDAAAADADCARGAARLGYIQHSHWTKPVGGVASAKELSNRYCPGGSNLVRCTLILREMLQPYAARMQSIIDGQRQQYFSGLPWLTARYAGLEAGLRQSTASIAARYAAATPTSRNGARR